MEFNKNLVATMKGKPALKAVWINEETGEWLFHETKGFTEFSREEVTGESTAATSTEKKVKYTKKMGLEKLKEAAIEKEIDFEEDATVDQLLVLLNA